MEKKMEIGIIGEGRKPLDIDMILKKTKIEEAIANYTPEQETCDYLARDLAEAKVVVSDLSNDKRILIGNLKNAIEWLNYFITAHPDDIYIEDARTVRWAAECCLINMEEDDDSERTIR